MFSGMKFENVISIVFKVINMNVAIGLSPLYSNGIPNQVFIKKKKAKLPEDKK